MHSGDPPGLFKDGAPVVCEGRWSKGAAFDSDRILIKHGNEYKPPERSTHQPGPDRESVARSARARRSGPSGALLGIGTLAVGLAAATTDSCGSGRRYVFVVLVAALLAAAVMEWALLTHDFSIEYVAENNARATPLLYTITGLWAALEGSILLWGLVLGGYLAFVAHQFRDRATDPLVAWATLAGLVVALFFFGLMLGPANPFKTLGTVPSDGPGPNPLLQNHPLMAFHPPMLYLGYVGFTVPFSFAIASLVTGRFGEGWLAETRRATLVAWGFLTVGIVLGAWWSYEVLGWGGYWAWDPVENASLLPWLTATAFIHSVMVQERRGMLRVWNLSLVIATFCLTILGTFLTRSGHPQLGPLVHRSRRSARRCSSSSAIVAATGIGLDRLARRPSARARVASTRRCRVSRRSSPTTCCSPRSRSSCSSAPCTRCSPRRCRTSSSRWASRTSTG